MLVVWLHTFVASDGWGAGVYVWVCVCGSGTRKDLPSHRDTLAAGREAWPILDAIAKLNASTNPRNLYMKKKLTRVHVFTFSLHPVPGCEKLVYTRIILLLLYFVSFAMHISHYWDNGQRNKQHIDCRCVSRQGLAGSSAHPLARCADLIGSLRSRIDISPTTTVVLG
jgi:hypothetical protein